MQILAGKINAVAIALAVGVASHVIAQDAPEASSGPAVPPTAASPTPSSEGAGASTRNPSDTSAALDYLYNRKPQDGSAGSQAAMVGKTIGGKAIAEDAIGVARLEDPELRGRFLRYLGTAEVSQEELAAYFQQMKKVSTLLRDNKLVDAWKELHDLADYQIIDAGISRELANRVEAIWNMDRASVNLDRRNEQLRKDVKTSNWNADSMSQRVREDEIAYQRRINQGARQQGGQQNLPTGGAPMLPDGGGGGGVSQPSMAGLEGKLQLTEEYLRSLELKAKIKVNELRQEQLLDQAKKDFSDYVATLYNSGRLNHVVLAGDFYRKVFQEGEYPAEMQQQVNASLEINRDVNTAVDVFRYKVEHGELVGAMDSLQQAFLTSELNPSVLGLERTLKRKIAEFNRQLDQMRNLIEARDFGNLESLLSKVRESAKDFDATKPMAIVNAVKLESKMRMGKAKLFAQQGNLEKAMEEFQAAAEAWPGNPDLEDKALTFFDTQDVQSQTLVEFDRLVKEQNYREIFDKQVAFAPALRDDEERQEAMKTALEAIKNAEMASEKANLLMMNGDFFGAWETIELAAADLPDDKKLNRMRAELSGRSAEFVSSVNKARDAENRSEIGYSLTWYVNAQRQYPASQFANEGIDRLSKKLLSAEL